VEKLSEKEYEQRSERGFGWYTEDEMDRKAPLWRPAGLRCERVRRYQEGEWVFWDVHDPEKTVGSALETKNGTHGGL
jgi:hypothetical protein